MDKGNPNPESSPHMQAILDIIKTLDDDTLTLRDVKKLLLEDSNTDCAITNKLNDVWNRHLYPNRVLRFAPIALYDLAPAISELSPEALKLLVIMVQVQAQRTGYVAVKKAIFADACGFGSKRTRQMQAYLDELVKFKFIKLIFQPLKGSSAPAVYQINSKFSRIGSTYRPDKLDKENTALFNRSTATIRVTKGDKETIYTCGTLEESCHVNKNGTDAVNINPVNEKNKNLNSTNHCTNKELGNQDIDDNLRDDNLRQTTFDEIL